MSWIGWSCYGCNGHVNWSECAGVCFPLIWVCVTTWNPTRSRLSAPKCVLKQHFVLWSRAKKRCIWFVYCGPAELWGDGLPQWTDNLRHTFACSASTFCLTCVLQRPRPNKPHVRVFIVFVSDELLAATRLQWGNWYANDMWQGYADLTQSQTFSPFSLLFTSFSLCVSELSWQQLGGRKTLWCCFSMSLWSTVIQPRTLLPIVTSRDSFNMLLVSRDWAQYSRNVNLMVCWCHRF